MTGFRDGDNDIVYRFSTLLLDAGVDQDKISKVAKTVRNEYAGSLTYVKKTDPMRDKHVIELFRMLGSVKSVANETKIAKTTVYDIIRRYKEK